MHRGGIRQKARQGRASTWNPSLAVREQQPEWEMTSNELSNTGWDHRHKSHSPPCVVRFSLSPTNRFSQGLKPSVATQSLRPLNSSTNPIRTLYVNEHKYRAHRNHTGIRSGDTKNPANSICGTKRIGSISCPSFGSSTAHPKRRKILDSGQVNNNNQ